MPLCNPFCSISFSKAKTGVAARKFKSFFRVLCLIVRMKDCAHPHTGCITRRQSCFVAGILRRPETCTICFQLLWRKSHALTIYAWKRSYMITRTTSFVRCLQCVVSTLIWQAKRMQDLLSFRFRSRYRRICITVSCVFSYCHGICTSILYYIFTAISSDISYVANSSNTYVLANLARHGCSSRDVETCMQKGHGVKRRSM